MQDRLIGRLKRLTHAISTRPARPTLSTVLATNEEIVPGAPCSIVTALTVLKYAATWTKEIEKQNYSKAGVMPEYKGYKQFTWSLSKELLFVRTGSTFPKQPCNPPSADPCHLSFKSTLLNSLSSSFTATEYTNILLVPEIEMWRKPPHMASWEDGFLLKRLLRPWVGAEEQQPTE